MAGREGLVAKKIMVAGKRGKHLRTYWIRPHREESRERQANLLRLKEAKHGEAKAKGEDTPALDEKHHKRVARLRRFMESHAEKDKEVEAPAPKKVEVSKEPEKKREAPKEEDAGKPKKPEVKKEAVLPKKETPEEAIDRIDKEMEEIDKEATRLDKEGKGEGTPEGDALFAKHEKLAAERKKKRREADELEEKAEAEAAKKEKEEKKWVGNDEMAEGKLQELGPDTEVKFRAKYGSGENLSDKERTEMTEKVLREMGVSKMDASATYGDWLDNSILSKGSAQIRGGVSAMTGPPPDRGVEVERQVSQIKAFYKNDPKERDRLVRKVTEQAKENDDPRASVKLKVVAVALASQLAYDSEEVEVYRGISGPQAAALKKARDAGEPLRLDTDGVTSFTEDPGVAKNFAKQGGIVIKVKVPRSSIMYSSRIGIPPTQLREMEVIVASQGGFTLGGDAVVGVNDGEAGSAASVGN